MLLDCLLGLKQLARADHIDSRPVQNFVRGKRRICASSRKTGCCRSSPPPTMRRSDHESRAWARPSASALGARVVCVTSSGSRMHCRASCRAACSQRSTSRVRCPGPELVLLDEAFSALDDVTASRLRQDFKTLAQAQSTPSFLIVTHSIDGRFFWPTASWCSAHRPG